QDSSQRILAIARTKKAPPKRGQANVDRIDLDGCFELLRSAECDLLAGLDLDSLAGSGVAPHACRTLAHLQDAEAVEADALALLEVLGNRSDHVHEHGVDL